MAALGRRLILLMFCAVRRAVLKTQKEGKIY